MIWTITPNPALDVTYYVDQLRHGASHRIEEMSVNPGGKGLNVARVLIQLGEPVAVGGLLGGATGMQLVELLAQKAPQAVQRWTDSHVPTRTSVAVVDDDATLFNEAGLAPAPAVWQELRQLIQDEVQEGDVVCISGSLPGDTPPHVFGELAKAAQESGARVVVDTSAAGLLSAAPHADLLKPNEHELADATGHRSIYVGVRALQDLGASAVAVSRGGDGMELWADGTVWRAKLPYFVEGNPTGAGDASVAAWARYMQTRAGDDWAAGLRDAVATSAAAVAKPVAGEIDLALRERLLPQIQIDRSEEEAC